MGDDSQARRIAIYKQDLLTSQTARWVRIFAVLLLAAIGTAATLATLTETTSPCARRPHS